MEVYSIIRKVKSIEGPILDIGFGKGLFSSSILDGIVKEELKPRDFIAFDSFNKFGGKTHPRWAIDFKNNALNKAKVNTSIEFGLVEEHLDQLLNTSLPAITYINLPTNELIDSAVKKTYEYITKGRIIIINLIDDSTIFLLREFCKDRHINLNIVSQENFSYIIKGDRIKDKNISPPLHTVANTVKRERSVNLT